MPFLLALLVAAAAPEPGLRLPAFSLQDPRGRTFTAGDWKGRSVVLVVTAPTLDQGGAQESWSACLDPLEWPADGPVYAWLEDFSQSWFKDLAMGQLKAKYDPPPWFLIDADGAVRRALGVPEGATWVLLYDAKGLLQAVERGAPTPARARALWQRSLPGGPEEPVPTPGASDISAVAAAPAAGLLFVGTAAGQLLRQPL